MPANYLIVNRTRREYFDPHALTGCVEFANFSVFDNVGRAIMLLTHHCDTPYGYSPLQNSNAYIGIWRGDCIITTGKYHSGTDLTGNNKCGNLHQVAVQKYDDISSEVLDMLRSYDQYARRPGPGMPPPATDDTPKPDPVSFDDDTTSDEPEQPAAPEKKKPAAKPDVVDFEHDGVRILTRYIKGVRHTIVQEKMANGDWHTIQTGVDDDSE